MALCVLASVMPTLAADAKVDGKEGKEVTDMLSQLTIAMSVEAINERTFTIRDSKPGSQQVNLRLGNAGPTPRGSLNDSQYAERVEVAKEALGKLVRNQLIHYKPAPIQQDVYGAILADAWSSDGKHIVNFLKKEGHLSHEQVYETDLAKDILTVASEEEKKENNKKLEEALRESHEAQREATKASQVQAEQKEAAAEGLGLAGWIGIAMVAALAVGAATNFGKTSNKKVNLNRKRGLVESFWRKLKGS